MQVRFSIARGQAVALDDSGEVLGTVQSILLDPDRGTVAGFYVSVTSGFMGFQTLFLSVNDIVRWGTAIFVKRAAVLAEPDEFLRVKPLLEDTRKVLGQPMVTKSGTHLGRCKDIQFDTLHFRVHWFFPKGFFPWGTPVAASDVLEITKTKIIVKDVVIPLEEEVKVPEVALPRMPEAA